MTDEDKTREQLLEELEAARQRNAELEGQLSTAAGRETERRLKERVKELNCLYGISKLMYREGITLEGIYQGTMDLIPPSWQYPEVTCARLQLVDERVFGSNSDGPCPTQWEMTSDVTAHGVVIGTLGVGYQQEMPEADEGPFLKEERQLLDSLAEQLGHITERMRAEEGRRRLEAQVQQAQKMESLGIVAGGIAHDFNNLLMGILGNADLALYDLPTHSPTRPLVKKILQAGRQAAGLTNQMLAYSGKGRFVVEELDINALVQDMSSLLASSTSKKVGLKFDLAENLPAVMADATQIRQIVFNLVSNASEAVGEEDGLVKVTTSAAECDRAFLCAAELLEELPEGHYVAFGVSDTGCGMDDETKAKLFDPFFTTKFTGRGLGLAAVHGIVRGHKGATKVESEPGEGTTFTVYLPALDRPAKPTETQANEKDWQSDGVILLVDDEETVREVAERFLERIGFTVLVAEDGAKALEVFRQHQDKITCVLLDLSMPNMDGEEAFAELRKIRGDVRVVLSSGYSEQALDERFAGEGLAGFIQKPYSVAALREKLAQVLGG